MRILLFIIFITSVCLKADQLNVDVSARSAILMNAETGRILFEKNKDISAFPASVTKIATLFYALEKKQHSLNASIIPSDMALKVMSAAMKKNKEYTIAPFYLEPDGTHMGIRRGETFTFETLLYGLMIASANDAANIIAEYVSESIPGFILELNEFVKKLGCQNTQFCNPHGLYHPCHITTAHDLAIILQFALKNSHFCKFASASQFTRPKTSIQPETTIYQRNKLFKKGKFFYPRTIAAKTGYVSHAGYTLAAAAKEEDRTLIAVVLGCPDDHSRYSDVIKLFDTAFNEMKVTHRLFDAHENLFTLSIKGAKNLLQAVLKEDFIIDYYPSERPEFKAELKWKQVHLPIVKGEIVGEIQLITKENRCYESRAVYATCDVQKTVWTKCKEIFFSLSSLLLKKKWLLFVLGVVIVISSLVLKKKIELNKGVKR